MQAIIAIKLATSVACRLSLCRPNWSHHW